MSAERSSNGRHHVKMWLCSLLAVPVLYVLAFPFLWFEFGWLPYYKSHRQHPRWLMLYADSYVWIADHTPLKKPMRAYLSWCMKKMRDARGIKVSPQDASP